MEINLEQSLEPLRAAATVVMVRDGASGLEVFLVKRHGLSEVLGGAHVFPGGKVDRDDSHADAQALLDTPAGELHDTLNEAQLDMHEAAALYFAALREAFEETGVLFAHGADAPTQQQAWALLREGRGFEEVIALMRLKLQASAIRPWSRWITPAVGGVIRKRFDTRFFLARMPEGQIARHDNHEAIDSTWLTPHDALRQYWDRAIELAPPQIMSLAHLARYGSVEAAMHDARQRPPPLIHPEPLAALVPGERVICYPGDSEHSIRERALPGPTRLHYRGKRFEPASGFQEFLD
ncbi:NUDIX hydrolase [Caenimonas sp. SL110]|uniref:NUDIX hydrolase n=1 Tax=Caenimonas sp. SL110 TaxID=1450524 RepID=UPI000654AC2B|nr:NUDIX hydrolase [Caenimonas sp. SL110]